MRACVRVCVVCVCVVPVRSRVCVGTWAFGRVGVWVWVWCSVGVGWVGWGGEGGGGGGWLGAALPCALCCAVLCGAVMCGVGAVLCNAVVWWRWHSGGCVVAVVVSLVVVAFSVFVCFRASKTTGIIDYLRSLPRLRN